MAIQDTIIVSFNDGSDVDHIAIAEVDEILNVDSDGETKTSFSPGDVIYIWLHISNNIRLSRVRTTAGTISAQGTATRSIDSEVLFSSRDEAEPTDYTSSVVPATNNIRYYGRRGTPTRSTSDIGVVTYTAEDFTNVPYMTKITHTFSVQLYRLTTPNVTLTGDATYPIGVVFYLEEA